MDPRELLRELIRTTSMFPVSFSAAAASERKYLQAHSVMRSSGVSPGSVPLSDPGTPLGHSSDLHKRRKVTRACDACKAKKKRCTGDIPCGPCKRHSTACIYEATYSRGSLVEPAPSDRRGNLATPGPLSTSHPGSAQLHSAPRSGQPIGADGLSTIEPQEVTSNEVVDTGSSSRRLTPEPGDAIDGQYHGPTSAHAFLGRAWRRLAQNVDRDSPDRADEEIDVGIFSFGDRKVPEPDATEFAWPEQEKAVALLRIYFDFASPTYRFLHEPTVKAWLDQRYQISGPPQALSDTRTALILLLFATASMYRSGDDETIMDAGEIGWRRSEAFFLRAQQILSVERGPPVLESIQARFATVQYLLATSRLNRAFFTFGTTVQLLQALGIYRKQNVRNNGTSVNQITHECQKRMFWCAFTLDKYLSIVMGRPALLRREDCNQELPRAVNDEDLTANRCVTTVTKDCMLHASIAHAKLSEIISKGLEEQYRSPLGDEPSQVYVAIARSEELQVWQSQLSPILSGVIHASSLIPPFRRQHTVLRLAYLHASFFVNRQLLLCDLSANTSADQEVKYRFQIKSCIEAAKEAVDLITAFGDSDQLYPSFWFSQYIAFNAIAIIYVFLIQMAKRRIPADVLGPAEAQPTKQILDITTLYEVSHNGQTHLAKASIKNAPAWRYNLVLESLRKEAARSDLSASRPNRPVPSADDRDSTRLPEDRYIDANATGVGTPINQPWSRDSGTMATADSRSAHVVYPTMLHSLSESQDESWWLGQGTDTMSNDLISADVGSDVNLDFWPQFDSLPISECFHSVTRMSY